MDKCTLGLVLDTCVKRSIQQNESYHNIFINGNMVEKGSLNVGDYFQFENRIYEIINQKDFFDAYEVRSVLFRFAKPYSRCESGNDEMVHGKWIHDRVSIAESWSNYSLVRKVEIIISVRN